MTTSIIYHKRGDAFAYAGSVPLPAGNWTGAAQLRKTSAADTDEPDLELAVTLTPPHDLVTTTGVLIHADASDTAGLKGSYLLDVQFTDADDAEVVMSTRTIKVMFDRDITHD